MFDSDRVDRLEELESQGETPYPTQSKYSVGDLEEFVSQYEDTADDFDGDGKTHTLAGTVTRFDSFGGLSFIDIQEGSASVQIQLERSRTAEYENLDVIQVGDIVQFTGEAIRSDTGELTLFADGFTMLSKSLQPRISDVLTKDLDIDREGVTQERRIRDRGWALKWDNDLFESVTTRFTVINTLRSYLQSDGYFEVDTPILHPTYGGGQATPFVTPCEAIDRDVYLRIAPELYLKRLIIGGYQQIFEIGPVFRNEDIDTSHHPEFTMLELYHAYSEVEEMMELTERLVSSVVGDVTGSTTVQYDETELDFSVPWNILDIRDGIDEYGTFTNSITEISDEEVISTANEVASETVTSRGDAIMELYDEWVEDEIEQPTFVVGFPPESTPLCKVDPEDPEVLDRFEVVVSGIEIANAYSEQNNPLEQQQAFEEQADRYDESDESYQEVDTNYLNDLSVGLPPTGGLGIGVDRLAQFCADEQSIKNVRPFVLTRD